MRRLHPATIVVAILPKLREALQAGLPVLIGTVASGHGADQEWIGIAIGGFTGIFAIGAYWTTTYDIEPDHVMHRTGWIFRKDRRIPLEQIQNVNLRQNVLERIFKVATVDVETAMGKGRDLKLSVLGLKDAERFREELLGAAHLTSAGAPRIDEPLVSLNRHDLFWGAVTESHVARSFAALVTVAGPAVGLVISYTAKLQPAVAAFAFAVAAMVLLLGGWAWGAVAYYLKYGGFVVHREESIFRISYGLLNKVQMAIRPSRIEFVRLTTTLLQRGMMRASLEVGTASTFGEAGVMAPVALFVERFRAYASVSDILPGLDVAKLKWEPFHPIFYRAAVVRTLITLALLAVIGQSIVSLAGGASVVWAIYTVIAAILLLARMTLFLARPENSFAITEEALVVRRGYFRQSISAMPIGRIENVAVTQPFWWRSRKAAGLMVQAMKHRIHVEAVPESAVEDLMARWHAKADATATLVPQAPAIDQARVTPSDFLWQEPDSEVEISV